MTPPNSAITVRIVGVTDVGLIREHNEDNFLVVSLDSGETDFGQGREVAVGSRGALLVVCDGMGGAAAGEVASKMAVDVILREMIAGSLSDADGKPTKPENSVDTEADTIPRRKVDELADAPTNPGSPSEAPAASSEAAPKPDAAPAAKVEPQRSGQPAPGPSRLTPRAIESLLAELADQTPLSITKPSLESPATAAEAEKPAAEAEKPAAQANAARTSADGTAAKTTADGAPASSGPVHEAEMHGLARKLRISAIKANQEIFDAACADIAKAGMGTTLTGLLLVGGHVIVAQVGDSRAYMWRNGKLTQITHDQSLVNQLLDSGQITPEQAKLFEHSNVILQALGVQEDVEVVLSSETVRRDDRLLLCSDGLVGVVDDDEIQEVLSTTEKIEDAARRLIEMARAGGGPDNITVIAAQVVGEGLPVPEPTDEVQYRPLYLDGDKPPERRVWAPEYGFIGPPAGSHSMPPGSGQPPPISSRVTIMAVSAVLALLVAGILIGVAWRKHPAPPASAPMPMPVVAPLSMPPPDAAVAKHTPEDAGAAAAATVSEPGDAESVQVPSAAPPLPAAAPPATPLHVRPPEPTAVVGEEPAKITRHRHKHHPGERPAASHPVVIPAGSPAAPAEKPVTVEKPAAPVAAPAQPAAPDKEKPSASAEKPLVEKPDAAEKPQAQEKPAAEKPAAPEKPAAADKEKPAPAEKPPAPPPAEKPAAGTEPAKS